MKRIFNKDAYDACDPHAKKVVSDYLYSKGIEAFGEGEEDYGVDLVALHPFGHELEVRQIWGDKFPYKTVHIPYRKKKVIDKNKNCYFWILNRDFSKALLIDGEHVKNSPVVEISANGKMDKFYDVNIQNSKEVKLK